MVGIGRKLTYAALLQPHTSKYVPLPIKLLTYSHREPRLTWKEEEVTHMFANEELEFAVVEKFRTDGQIYKI